MSKIIITIDDTLDDGLKCLLTTEGTISSKHIAGAFAVFCETLVGASQSNDCPPGMQVLGQVAQQAMAHFNEFFTRIDKYKEVRVIQEDSHT